MDNEIKKFDFTPLPGNSTLPPADSMVTYLDDNNNPVSKEQGTHVKITEFDENGNVINEVWGNYTPEQEVKSR